MMLGKERFLHAIIGALLALLISWILLLDGALIDATLPGPRPHRGLQGELRHSGYIDHWIKLLKSE